jgi:hypothetical protein
MAELSAAFYLRTTESIHDMRLDTVNGMTQVETWTRLRTMEGMNAQNSKLKATFCGVSRDARKYL